MSAQPKKPASAGGSGRAVSFDLAACEAEAKRTMESIGLIPPGRLKESEKGAFNRCPTVSHPAKKNGSYRWFSDGVPYLRCWNHETHDDSEWKPEKYQTGNPLSAADIEQYRQRREQCKREEEQARDAKRQNAINKTLELLTAGHIPNPGWPYLIKKGISHHADRFRATQDDSSLIFRIYDTTGKLTGGQQIFKQKTHADTDKIFIPGSSITGAGIYTFAETLLGSDSAPHAILITEGVATAASVYDATGGVYPVVAGLNAGNLKRVATGLKERFPATNIVVCGDVDENQTGQKAALAAAEAVGGSVILPDFQDLTGGGSDFNDLWSLDADEARRQLRAGLEPKSHTPRFNLRSADDLAALPEPRWRVKGVLPETGTAALYGQPGSGKSFLALHLAGAIGTGADWFGNRVSKSPVVYLALEGQGGLRNRTRAFLQAHGQNALDGVHFITDPFDIVGNTDSLIDDLQNARLQKLVIIIDTLNRATPGLDENAGADMGKVIAACKRLELALDALVILVHHAGKDSSRGLRGHSSLLGALDVVLTVEKNASGRMWSTEKVKDGRDDLAHRFELEEVLLGHDADGDKITSCVIEIPPDSLTTKEAKRDKTRQMSRGHVSAAYDTLEGLEQQYRINKPDGPILVEERHWRENYLASLGGKITPANKRKIWERVRKDLLFNLQIVERVSEVHVASKGDGVTKRDSVTKRDKA